MQVEDIKAGKRFEIADGFDLVALALPGVVAPESMLMAVRQLVSDCLGSLSHRRTKPERAGKIVEHQQQ